VKTGRRLLGLAPPWLRGYQRAWLRTDILAGTTLAAVAIPETMGYTTIAQMPVVTGLYTVLLPTVVFALLGSSALLVVGADSATAAVLAAGLAALSISGLTPDSPKWVAFAGLVALVTAAMLVLARLLRLGFIGDFLSASVLVGFLSGVGVQVLSGQIPSMLGIPKGDGGWLEQQWDLLTSLSEANGPTCAFAAGAVLVIVGARRFFPSVPGAIVAVVGSIALSSALDVGSDGVALVGEVAGGAPPLGLPEGIGLDDVPAVLGVSFSCFVLIIAQSAATSRSFAVKHGQRVDVNRDLVGLAGANVAAGLSGTFVVNGSPTKTQILDTQKGRTQVANLTMSAVVLVVLLFATALLADMPEAVLASIVFLVGIDLVDVQGLRRIRSQRLDEFLIAALTAAVVVLVGVQEGIVLAVVLSILGIIRRQYRPSDFVVGVDKDGVPTYQPVAPGAQTLPGLIVFRYDAELFYANANQFSDHVQTLVEQAPDPVRWLVLDCTSLSDVDYSAAMSLARLRDYLHARHAAFVLAGPDPALLDALRTTGVLDTIAEEHILPTVHDAVEAYRALPEVA
jgi:high affinity sulfate transporter 1